MQTGVGGEVWKEEDDNVRLRAGAFHHVDIPLCLIASPCASKLNFNCESDNEDHRELQN